MNGAGSRIRLSQQGCDAGHERGGVFEQEKTRLVDWNQQREALAAQRGKLG